nr:bile acid:sodium symporter [Corynebacterium sp. UBA5992]
MIAAMERRQVLLYALSIAFGVLLGLGLPGLAGFLEHAITPVLMALLYATFLAIPFSQVLKALRDWRFLGLILALNFVAGPVVVWLVTRPLAAEQSLLVGALFVLLCPCVDYVIVFAGLAGGDTKRLLSVTPVLMGAQMLLLPFYLWLFAGPSVVGAVEFGPFLEAFLLFIVVPLAAAIATQAVARRSAAARGWESGVAAAMVPLMMATLAVVVASQIAQVSMQVRRLWIVVPVFVAFALIMLAAALVCARVVRMDAAGTRALAFSAVTRNSLVVLPLVLALPAQFALAPLVVVTQTLVELVLMVILVRMLPRWVRQAC